MLIKKYVKLLIKDKTASIDNDLYFYKNDKNIDVMFELVNFKFDFIKNQLTEENTVITTNASYATLRIIKPNGEKILVTRCPVEGTYIKFEVTPDFIDELDEVGTHQLQITLYDEFEGRISVPPISFEVLEPLFDDEGYYDEGQVNITQTNIVTTSNRERALSDINGRPEIFEGTNLYEWRHGDWLSDIRLNAIHENIVKLNNMTADDIEYTTNGNETIQDALDMLLGVDSEEVVVPIISDKVTTTNHNQELISYNNIITQVTIFNQSENEVNVIINQGEVIPLDIGESLSLGNIKIFSIIVIEAESTIKYIGY